MFEPSQAQVVRENTSVGEQVSTQHSGALQWLNACLFALHLSRFLSLFFTFFSIFNAIPFDPLLSGDSDQSDVSSCFSSAMADWKFSLVAVGIAKRNGDLWETYQKKCPFKVFTSCIK